MTSPTMLPSTIADRHQRVAQVVDPLHPAFQDRGDEEDHDQLGELGGLHADPGDAEPPPRAIDAGPEEQHRRPAPGRSCPAPSRSRPAAGSAGSPPSSGTASAPGRAGRRCLFPQEIGRALAYCSSPMTAEALYTMTRLAHTRTRVDGEQQLVRFEFPCHSDLKFSPFGPDKYSELSRHQSGRGERHRPRRPGQPAFPAASSSPPRPD